LLAGFTTRPGRLQHLVLRQGGQRRCRRDDESRERRGDHQ
jgi:hypothetical protein